MVASKVPQSLTLPLLFLRLLGLFSVNLFKRYFPVSIFALLILNVIAVAMLQFININKNVSDFVRNLEAVLTFVQSLGKLLLVTYHANDCLRLVENTMVCWRFDRRNEEAKEETKSIRRLIFYLQATFILSTLLTLCIGFVLSIRENALIFGVWTMNGHKALRRIIMVEYPIMLTSCACFVVIADSMYLGFCAEIVIQFRTLCHYLKTLSADEDVHEMLETNYFTQLKTFVEYHHFVIKFVKEFQKMFSLILLVEYITIGPLICIELFAALESPSYELKSRYMATFVAVVIQMSFYCIPANYIEKEALAVSDSVYSSGWYFQSTTTLKVPLMLMMLNSQNGVTIKAWGLITINAATVVKILKVAWSACSLLQGLRQN